MPDRVREGHVLRPSHGRRGTLFSWAVDALRRSFVKPCALDAHSRLQQLKFDPATPLDAFVIRLRKLVSEAFPGSVCDQVLFHSFLTALPREYQQQVIAAGVATFPEAVEKVGNLIRSERVPAPVRQVSQACENAILEKLLQRLEQLECQVARAAPPSAREFGSRRDQPAGGRRERGGTAGERPERDRRACFSCGSQSHLRATCPTDVPDAMCAERKVIFPEFVIRETRQGTR